MPCVLSPASSSQHPNAAATPVRSPDEKVEHLPRDEATEPDVGGRAAAVVAASDERNGALDC